jgi:hypothetical protein
MKYILLIHQDEKAWAKQSDAERRPIYKRYMEISEELMATGQHAGGAPLEPTSAAVSVRLREGKRLVTDGPFAETREQLGGYFIVDVESADEAIKIAQRLPAAQWGTIEVRPIVEARVPAAV